MAPRFFPRRVTALPALLAVLAACSGGGGQDVPFVPDEVVQDTGGEATDPGLDGDSRPPTQVAEPFRIVFPYYRYTPPAEPVRVLWTDPSAMAVKPSTSLDDALLAVDPALSCANGCIVDRSGRWLAVVVALPDDSGGSKVHLFRLFDGPTVRDSGIADIVDVRAFAFGTDSFVFTRAQYGCYESDTRQKACAKFFRIDLSAANPAGEESLFTFPTEADLDKVLAPSGNFRIGDDGRTVIVLGPTVGSQSVWLWRGPTGLPIRVAGPICGAGTIDGACQETGSAFSDTDPVALSPDGNHLVLALVENDRALVLVHVDLRQAAGTRKTASLLKMAEGISFAENACYNRQPWQPTFMQAPIRFSPDGTEVVFVAGTDCSPNRTRPWTNVLALALARIDDEGTLARDALRRITEFPTDETRTACVSILPGSLDLSPTGDHVVFAGSPMLDSEGTAVIPDGQQQLYLDAEVWAVRRDATTAPVQLTAKQGWKATSTLAIAVPPTP